jgi:ABC-type glycerol-3-phosphate transport system substrate-binding protein
MELSSGIVSGLFTDHKKLIENDPDLDISDFSQNIVDEFTYKGDFYTLPVYYYSTSMFGQNELSGWDYNAIMSCSENGAPVYDFYSSSFYEVFRMLFLSYAHDHVDFETGECDLDNETFIKLLEFIKENSVAEEDFDDINNGYYSSQFEIGYIGDLNDFWMTMNTEREDGVRTSYVYGYPSEDGGKKFIIPGLCFSVTESCQNKQAALDFIKTFFGNDTQGISTIRKKAIESAENHYMPEIDASDIMRKYEDYLDMPVFSDMMYCRLEQIALGCAEEFINGSISAEEAAGNIQSKISIYLAELL